MRRGGGAGPEDERGLAMVYFALTITIVLIAASFAVDLGWWYVRAQQAQRAADAASLAGVVWMPRDFTKATAVARASAKANGFEDGVMSISVVVTRGATDRQLTVRIVDGNVTRFFSGVVSKNPMSIGRQATAQYELAVPLGAPENQFGGGRNGVYLAVSGYCTRRADGDQFSSAYYNTSDPSNNISCPTPFSSASPSGSVAKNPDYRTGGYAYVVSIPPAQTTGCSVATPPSACSRTAGPVTIQVQDPKLNTNTTTPQADQYNFNNGSGCSSRPGTTFFSVYGADGTPLDDNDNPILAGPFSHGTEADTSAVWETLFTVPTSSVSGRYLVRVRSASDQACAAWSNAFGLRAQVGSTFRSCSTIPGSALPTGYTFCPQVHGLDAMGLRVVVEGASTSCAGTKVTGSNLCNSFYLAQVDPVYAGREMAITLFDPGEGAQRIRVLGPNGSPIGFSYTTNDTNPDLTGDVTAGSTGLNVSGSSSASNFNDRKLELSVTLPDAAGLTTNGGWFKVEYEVGSTSASLTDRTTWSVNIRGAALHLVA